MRIKSLALRSALVGGLVLPAVMAIGQVGYGSGGSFKPAATKEKPAFAATEQPAETAFTVAESTEKPATKPQKASKRVEKREAALKED